MQKVIGVYTSGGDSCGMNDAVVGVLVTSRELKIPVFVIEDGYEGMIGDRIHPASLFLQSLGEQDIGSKGGTALGSARCARFREREGRMEAAANLLKHGINCLVCIGGDGSLTGADLMRKEWPSLVSDLRRSGKITDQQANQCPELHVAGIVGTIDNDFIGTDLTLGTDSALQRIADQILAIRDTAASHHRTFVIEIMGRHCGYLTLRSGVTSGADFIMIPEDPVTGDWKEIICHSLKRSRDFSGKRFSLVLVCEGAIDRQGKKISSAEVADVIKSRLKHEVRIQVLGHVQRGGPVSLMDKLLGLQMGGEAVRSLVQMDHKSPSVVIGIHGSDLIHSDLVSSVRKTQEVGEAIAAKDFDRAVRLRGPDFQRLLGTFRSMSQPMIERRPSLTQRVGSSVASGIRSVTCFSNCAARKNSPNPGTRHP